MIRNLIMKTPIITQKEQELGALNKEHKKCIRALNKEKSVLAELKEKIVGLQKDTSKNLFHRMERLNDLKKELSELLKEGQKSKFINKSDKKQMKEMLRDIEQEDLFGIPKGFGERPDLDDDFNNKSPHEILFGAFKVEINEQEKQNIRKIFINLATRFHPDKAVNSIEADRFHSIMQRINLAYKRLDIGELLEIETSYGSRDILLSQPDERGILDFLEEDIERLKHEIHLLKQQLVRVKKEICDINKSELGAMLKDLSKHSKKGFNPIGEMTEQLDFAYEELSFMKDSIAQLLKKGTWPKAMLDKLERYSTDDESMEDFADSLIVEMVYPKDYEPKKKIRNTRRPKTTQASKY